MYVPDKAHLHDKSPVEKVEFWFNYWNELYPIKGLSMEFESEGYIESYSAYADVHRKRTVFNQHVLAGYSHLHGHYTSRHEHVHQLLNHHGYDFKHSLLFALVDNALAYAYEELDSQGKISEALLHTDPDHHKTVAAYLSPANSLRHYDLHEDPCASRNLSTRMMLVCSKRLSRHAHDIQKLLATAKKYADAISLTAPDKRVFRNLSRQNKYLQGVNKSAFDGWIASADQCKSLTSELEEAQEQVTYLNELNMKWQGAFVLLTIMATAILVRVAP